MYFPSPVVSLANSAGPDPFIILFILVLVAAPVAAVALVVAYLSRRKPAQSPPPPTGSSTAERLQQLDQLRKQGSVSDAEHEEQRRRIISDI